MDSKPGLGRGLMVMALDFGVMVVAAVLWRSWGWPYALGALLVGMIAVWGYVLHRREA